MSFVKEHYQKLRRFYRGDFSYFLHITAAAFLVLVIGSFVVGLIIPEYAQRFVEQFMQQVADLGIVDENGTITVADLFANNMRATIISMVYGLIPMVFLPALSLGINASMMGILAAYYTNQGVSLWYYLMGTLPHGIFELPALALSLASGLYLCRTATARMQKKSDITVKAAIFDCLRVLVIQAAPLLLAAAVVEAYVTPHILNLFH